METALIAVFGSIAAFAFTHWTARFVDSLMPYPIAVSIQPDARVLAFAIVVGVFTSAAFGLLPAMRTARVDLHVHAMVLARMARTIDRGRARAALSSGRSRSRSCFWVRRDCLCAPCITQAAPTLDFARTMCSSATSICERD
jgi:hypothetical protein